MTKATDPRLVGSGGGWIWFGYAGHLIMGSSCRFHLATYIPERQLLVSTVGDYHPRGTDKRETIGSGKDDFFETAVLRCEGIEPSGDPRIPSWDFLACRRYKTSLDAEKGHYEMLTTAGVQ